MAAPMFSLPYATTNYGTYTPTPGTYQPVTYQPLGDWKTPMGLTQNWGKAGTPVQSWFAQPSKYIQTITAPVPTTVAPLAMPKLANPATALPGQKYEWGSAPYNPTAPTTGIGALAQLINPVTAMAPKVTTPAPKVTTPAPKVTAPATAPKVTTPAKTTPVTAKAPAVTPVTAKTK